MCMCLGSFGLRLDLVAGYKYKNRWLFIYIHMCVATRFSSVVIVFFSSLLFHYDFFFHSLVLLLLWLFL